MKHRNALTAVTLAAALMSLVAAPRLTAGVASTRAAIAIAPGSVLWMEGKSTVHAWESRTSTVSVAFTRDAAQADPADAAGIEAMVRSAGVRGVDVEIPVATLRSGKSGLDKNMMKSLKADQYPAIRFHMERYSVIGPATGDTLNLRAEGDLTVSGKKKDITLEARAWKGEKGVWVSGIEPLTMSDFGIKPPVMMMGAIKTDDRIVIHYRLLLAPAVLRAAGGTQGEK